MKTSRLVLAILALAGWDAPAQSAEGAADETAIKAVFLTKFGDYVEWPNMGSEMTICIAGGDPLDGALDKAAEGQKIHALPIVIRRLGRAGRDAPCQIVYIAEHDATRAAGAIDEMRGAHVLTVADSAPNAIVRFVVQESHVRFEINEQSAAENGLVISSKLLKLALSVKPRS